jgi:hypothetical protein
MMCKIIFCKNNNKKYMFYEFYKKEGGEKINIGKAIFNFAMHKSTHF